MRGLLITPYHRRFGGVEVMNQYLHRALSLHGIALDRLAAEDYVEMTSHWRMKIFGMPAASAAAFSALSQKYDFVICNGEFAWGIEHPLCICLFHGSYAGLLRALKKQFSFKSLLVNMWLAKIQQWGSRNKIVVTVSRYNQHLLQSVDIQVDEVINNPVDLHTYHPSDSASNGRCLFVGSYQHYPKGFDVLEKIAAQGEKIDCVTDKIPAASLGYLGEVPREDLPILYRQYDCLIHPSRFESSCLVGLEAMASGIPILMNPVGIGADLLNHIPEFVIPFDLVSLEEIADRIALLRSRRQHFSELARQYVCEYHSFEHYHQQWNRLIQHLVSGNDRE